MQLDVTRVAVEAAGESLDPDSIRSIVESYGATMIALQPLGIPPWYFIELKPKTNSEIETLTASLAMEPTIAFVSPVLLSARGGWMIPTREILMQTVASSASSKGYAASNLLRGLNFTHIPWDLIQDGVILETNSGNGFLLLQAANELAVQPDIHFAEPNMIFSGGSASIPNDPGFTNCWGIHNTGQFGGIANVDMDGPEAWDLTTSNAGIIVVIIDSGVQQDHPDINQLPGADLTTEGGGGGPVNSFDRHGTVVAGTISGIMNNALGTVGIAPGCVTASARTFITTNSQGEWVTKEEWTVEALAWAESIGARITNNSNFYGFESSAIAQKYLETRASGMVHFASAGNRSVPTLEYPATLPDVVSSAALQNSGTLASFSSFGPDLDLVAPGVDIFTTDRTGGDGYLLGSYGFFDGSSFASSYSAGVAALFVATHPTASASTVEEALKQSATDLGTVGRDDTFGWGLVNARNAIDWDPQCTQTPTPLPETGEIQKNRYLSLEPTCGNRMSAIAITIETTLPQWKYLIGKTFWVGEPSLVVVGPGVGSEFLISNLACIPVFRDWSDISTLHITGPEIIPSTTYHVQHVYEPCYAPEGTVASAPLVVTTPRWGDIVAPFNPPSLTTQPDFVDVSAVVDRFRSAPSSPDLTRADLEPQTPNQDVNFSDISAVIDAFKGLAYPFAGPCPCGESCP